MGPANPRIKLPENIKIGDVIEIKTLITHTMETGHRTDKDGKPIARNIINTFIAKFGDDEIFRAELGPGVSANPYISFHMRVPAPGTLECVWIDDAGAKTVERTPLNAA